MKKRFLFVILVLCLIFAACDNGTVKKNNDEGSEVITTEYTVYDETTWKAALSGIRSGGNNKLYVINVTGNFDVDGAILGSAIYSFGDVTGITVSINGNYGISLKTGTTGTLLYLNRDQTVVINDTDFKGNIAVSSSSLIQTYYSNLTMAGSASVTNHTGTGAVYIVNGSFTMKDSARVANNTNNSSQGGGLRLNNCTAVMTDNAEVRDNTATYAGGVYQQNGTFTMSGNATVAGNTATQSVTGHGGGVYITAATGTADFTMQGSAGVTGNTAEGSGGGIYASSNNGSTATVNMRGGVVSGNESKGGSGAQCGGGGICVYSPNSEANTIFRIEAGAVYGNTYGSTPLQQTLRNYASGAGAALFVKDFAKAYEASFSGTTWTNGTPLNTRDTSLEYIMPF